MFVTRCVECNHEELTVNPECLCKCHTPALQPPPVCCDPSAPIVKCCVCGADIHTCERMEPVNHDYRCPLHGNGVELNAGEWVCSDACGYERMFAGYVARIAALEAQLAEAQEQADEKNLRLSVLSMASDEGIYGGEDPESALDCIRAVLDQNSKLRWRILRLCNADSAQPDDLVAGVDALREELAAAERKTAESQERLAMVVEAASKIHHWHCWGAKEEGMVVSSTSVHGLWDALAATAASVAQHIAEVERRGAAKFRDAALGFIGYVIASRLENQSDYMAGLAEEINKFAAAIGEEDRVEFGGDGFKVIRDARAAELEKERLDSDKA